MTILVTGASGLLGRHLCETLFDAGNDVVGLYYSHKINIKSGITTVSCNITDYDSVCKCVEHYKPDTVFHMAAHLPSTIDPDFISVNVKGTSNLLSACCRNDICNFIYASSMSVYSSPPVRIPVDECHPTKPHTDYGKTKFIGELLCNCYYSVMKTIIIRFSSVFGPGDYSRVTYRFMRNALDGNPVKIDGDGSQSSDFIHVQDAVNGAVLAARYGKSSDVYNIGSGEETSILELGNMIAGLGDKNSKKVDVKLSENTVTRPFRFAADIEKARKELGYRPGDLMDGLIKYREKMINAQR